jgi:nitronate monooxygenase
MTPSVSAVQDVKGKPFPGGISARLALPVIAAPMFLVSGPALVIACCRAGIVGTVPALNQRTSEGFADWLGEIRIALSAQRETAFFGVNLIVHSTNPRLQQDLKICREYEVPLVITSLGIAPELVREVHGYGGLVFHDVVSRRHAEKAAAAGVDGLILVCGGAGGHAGTANPFAFIAEIRAFFEGTIILAGGISTGAHVAAAEVAGADLAYMGTRFIATQESLADPKYKQLILDSGVQDVIYTPAVSGVPANFLRGSLERSGLLRDGQVQSLGAKSHGIGEEQNGQPQPWKDIWSAGHGVGAISDVPTVADLATRMTSEYRGAIRQVERRVAAKETLSAPHTRGR